MRRLLYIFGVVSFTSCMNVDSVVPDVARPVVQAYLMPGRAAEVDVWRESIFLDTDTIIDTDGLDLTIDADGTSYPMTLVEKSRYVNNSLIVDASKMYTLKFRYNNEEVSATTTIPSKPKHFSQADSVMVVPAFGFNVTFPDPIEFKWTNDDGSYHIVIIESTETNPVQINESRGGRPPFAFRNDPTTGNSYSLRAQSFQYYGKHRVILMKVTADYAALYQQNGTSSINIKTPFTNVTNGLGIFTGVNSDTLMVKVKAP